MDDHAHEHHAEVIFIKKKGGHGAGHHGGAWKIAFADFMTAMMAFFLVLWIINATDKDTKTVIARYFNPVKLENPARAKKGVHGVDANNPISDENGDQIPGAKEADTKVGEKKEDKKEDKKEEKKEEKKKEDKKKDDKEKDKDKDKDKNKAPPKPEPPKPVEIQPTMSEAALFADPYQSLNKIAAGSAAMSPAPSPNTGAEDPTREAGATTVEAFRDPFKPVGPGAMRESSSLEADTPPPPPPYQQADIQPQKGDPTLLPEPVAKEAAPDAPPPDKPAERPAPELGTHTPAPKSGDRSQPNTSSPPPAPGVTPAPTPSPGPSPLSGAVGAVPAPTPSPGPSPLSGAAGATQLNNELMHQLGGLAKSASSPNIEVKATSEGLLISVTDRLTFSMFAIGSAEPRPEVIKAMDSIALALKNRTGTIVLRGHTDGRQYKSATYDNWRLSSARAQMAYYMLAHGGVPEARIERVEGYADRVLRDPAHPLAAENRRLEILVRETKP